MRNETQIEPIQCTECTAREMNEQDEEYKLYKMAINDAIKDLDAIVKIVKRGNKCKLKEQLRKHIETYDLYYDFLPVCEDGGDTNQ